MAPTYKPDSLNNWNMYGFFFVFYYKIYKHLTGACEVYVIC